MSALAVRWLAGFAIFAAVFAAGYWRGNVASHNAWLAKQAIVERDAHAKYEVEVKRGDAAVGALVTDARTLQGNFQNLTEKFNALSKHTPLVVAAAPRARSADGCGVGAVSPEANAPANGLPADDVVGPGLTAAAVWMWNSALTGADQPSGACGSLDTSEAACAVATTLTVDDAWANHTRNAKLCAEDRLVHQRLIDFLTPRNLK